MNHFPVVTKVLIVCAATMALHACASSNSQRGPNGGVALRVECGGSGIDSCYQPAAKACPNGYTFFDQQAKPNGTTTPSTTGFFIAGSNAVMVECRK